MYGYSEIKREITRPIPEVRTGNFFEKLLYRLILIIKAMSVTTNVEKAKSSISVMYICITSF